MKLIRRRQWLSLLASGSICTWIASGFAVSSPAPPALQEPAEVQAAKQDSEAAERETEVIAEPWRRHEGDHEELLRMFEADQEIRHEITPENMREKLPEMSKLDRTHRARLVELMEEGALKTPYDFFRASVMFQHQTGGSQIGLELALVAMRLGCEEAPGMVARAYDRFLFEDLNRGQRFGTQRGPDRRLRKMDTKMSPITDEIRELMGVSALEGESSDGR
ncbi:MAG: hypothetical protein RL885_22610 [Planctomycetota bacterium]